MYVLGSLQRLRAAQNRGETKENNATVYSEGRLGVPLYPSLGRSGKSNDKPMNTGKGRRGHWEGEEGPQGR